MRIFKKIKYFSFLLIIVILNTSFAAVVSDNDGSSFITKAEFDSLKNNFQSQLDGYNQGIDSKIDSAIAAYLSGVSVSSTRFESQICYTPDGILSPRASYKDLNFVEGQLNWNVNWFILSKGGGGKITVTGKTPTDFKEMGINDIYKNSSNKYVASWTGYITDKQQMTQTCNHITTGENFSDFVDTQKMQANAHGIIPYSNVRWNTDTTQRCMIRFSFSGYETEPWGTWSFNTIQSTATRTISATKNTNIIITPKSVSCKRFSRLDDVYDWTNCADPDTTTFRKLTDGNANADIEEYGFASIKMDFYRGSTAYDPDDPDAHALVYKKNLAGAFKKGKALTRNNGAYYITSSGGYSGTKPSNWDSQLSWQPYLGFCNYYTDYNQLYIKQYDNMVSDMKTSHPDLNVIKDANSVEHLALNAGAPIVFAKKDEKVTFDIAFADLTKNYDMWFKVGSFSYNNDPNVDTDLINSSDIKYLTTSGSTSIVPGKAANSFKIPNGKCSVEITMPKDGYLFTKWQYEDTSIVGGGTYKPASNIKITSTGK